MHSRGQSSVIQQCGHGRTTAQSGSLTDEAALSCCSDLDPSTKDFLLQQTMLRIKDPKKSLDFL